MTNVDPIMDSWDAMVDGEPPADRELPGPIGDPGPDCPIVCLGARDGIYHFLARAPAP